jgi:RNA polymerase sigma-70 factor (sigma-E family)
LEFEQYVAARGQALLRLAYVLTGDAHAAEDLTQAALYDTLRHWRKVARADHPDAYVRRVLVNRHLATSRRRSSSEVVLDDVEPLATAVAPDPATGVADRDEARRVLAELPPRARAVLVLRYYADLDDAAIADTLGVAPGTVRSTASRALATLREQLSRPARPAEPDVGVGGGDAREDA